MIQTIKALIKRECWEHRGAFFKAPIIIGIVLMILTIGGYITGLVLANKAGATSFTNKLIYESSKLNKEEIMVFWDIQMTSIASLYLMVLFFVIFFFLLGSLFDDRKDQSILFWKSLPISDATTVLSKILTAMFVAPLVFVLVYVALILVLLVLYSIILLFHGLNPMQLVWSPANVFSGFMMMLGGAVVQMFWALPIYGWLMFSSSFSKRRPFLFAVFIPAIFAFSWYFIKVLSFKFLEFEMFSVPLKHLGKSVLPFASGSIETGGFHFGNRGSTESIMDTLSLLQSSLLNLEILYGAIFGAILVSLSIWIRRYRNTT